MKNFLRATIVLLVLSVAGASSAQTQKEGPTGPPCFPPIVCAAQR